MNRVLLVYHDTDVADIEADELRRAGYAVDRCAGPIGGTPCPVLHGEACWQVEEADVLVYDTWESDLHGEDLVASLRAVHPDTPLVLTSSRPAPIEARGERVWHAPTRASLVGAIESALQAPKAPHRPTASRAIETYTGPRW